MPYALTIVCSSLLSFLVQPIIAKAILPRFGGSAGVWVTCMLFFQVVLLAGYLYSYWVTRQLSRKAQTVVHVVLLIASLGVLPVHARAAWLQAGNPVLSILGLLAISVGLPYFLLSTTSPLMQSWYAESDRAGFPYRLFAVSNAASLAALLLYPVGIEPLLSQKSQFAWWSGGYGVFVVLAAWSAVRNRAQKMEPAEPDGLEYTPLRWIALAACASTLWLAVANHLSQEVAAIPFLWILPLSLYLLSFILCFEGSGWYRPLWFRWLLPAAWIAVTYRLSRGGGGLQWEIPILSAALFVCCMFCHGELAESKPQPKSLAYFYLMVALGGALGAVFVGVVAPNLFNSYLELPIGITGCVLLALALLYGYASPRRLLRVALMGALAFVVATRFNTVGQDVVHTRNFYGTVQVSDSGDGDSAVRSLYNGRTLHGVQFLAPARSRQATAFFSVESGAGRVLQLAGDQGRRVGIIGLGAGTLAGYGRRGDSFVFFEINPAVIEVASRHYRFLAESEARTAVQLEDGRLAIEREPANSFDVLVVDAFSDDSIPVHLLTMEAFQAYFSHLRPGGLLAIHITNRYLDLYPVVDRAARNLGKKLLWIHNDPDGPRHVSLADWVVLGDDGEKIRQLSAFSTPRESRMVRLWTDEYSNLFRVLR